MKVTEDDFTDEGGGWFVSHVSQDTKKQILENQKIVDELLNEYNGLSKHNVHGYPPKFTPYDYGMQTIENIIKKATGKDIQEIQSQPKVKDEN